jgi:hypothetical protein
MKRAAIAFGLAVVIGAGLVLGVAVGGTVLKAACYPVVMAGLR